MHREVQRVRHVRNRYQVLLQRLGSLHDCRWQRYLNPRHARLFQSRSDQDERIFRHDRPGSVLHGDALEL